MSKDELRGKVVPVGKTIYGWLQSGKNFIALLVCAYGLYNWASGQFTEVKAMLAEVRANAHYIDTDRAEHNTFYAMCYKQDARIDTIEWYLAGLRGSDSVLTDEIIGVKNRVFQLENK
jgi:hypothetical protein